jgi:hypothetical protein
VKTVNSTPFALFGFLGEIAPPQRVYAFALKATFKLVQDGVSTPAPKQREPQRDEPYMDDIGRSLAWASDYVAYKPRLDFIVIGAFHQPDGKAAPEGRARIKFGPIEKELVIRGPRFLASVGDDKWQLSEALPIAQLPLRWEYSFGGLDDPRNPLGLGIDPEPGEKPPCIHLPLIEYPDDSFRSPGDRPRPANFAPVPPRFSERRLKLGTRDKRWATFRAPLPPKDFDPSVHNAAPGDQQAEGYPRGTERIRLSNLHPRFAEFTGRLPGLRARAGILRRTALGLVAEEAPMRLDTVVVLPEEDELVLVWRGAIALGGKTADEIELLQVETEPAAVEPAPFEGLAVRMWEAYEQTLPPEPEPEPPPDISGEMAQMRNLLAKVDLPPAVRDIVANESDPSVVFDALEKHLNDTLAALQAKYAPGA